MDETLAPPDVPAAPGGSPPVPPLPDAVFPDPRLRLGYDPNSPAHEVAAVHAYIMDFDELVAHLAAHPDQKWVAYHGSQRVGFGTDDLALERECAERFPGERCEVFGIDPTLACSPFDIEF